MLPQIDACETQIFRSNAGEALQLWAGSCIGHGGHELGLCRKLSYPQMSSTGVGIGESTCQLPSKFVFILKRISYLRGAVLILVRLVAKTAKIAFVTHSHSGISWCQGGKIPGDPPEQWNYGIL
jgi:hypothetical protein